MKPIYILLFLFVTFAATSCKKCIECEYLLNDVLIKEEECGKRKDRKAFQTRLEIKAQSQVSKATCKNK
jgi:hypothetical protein